MREQEEKLRSKYGNVQPKKKLIHKVRCSLRTRRNSRTRWLARRTSLSPLCTKLGVVKRRPLINSPFSHPTSRYTAGCQVLRFGGLGSSAGASIVLTSSMSHRMQRTNHLRLFVSNQTNSFFPLCTTQQQDKSPQKGDDVGTLPSKLQVRPNPPSTALP